MERCLAKLGCDLCSCVFPSGELSVMAWLYQIGHVETYYWILEYSTFLSEPNRRLCRIGRCPECGKLYCESQSIPEEKSGNVFLATVYRLLYQQAYHMKPEYRDSSVFREAFLDLFKEIDRPEVLHWLALPENQNIHKIYRN